MAKAKTEFRVMLSPLTGTVYAGRVTDLGGGNYKSATLRHDVTQDFHRLTIEYAQSKGGAYEIVGGGETYDVTVTKRAPAAA